MVEVAGSPGEAEAQILQYRALARSTATDDRVEAGVEGYSDRSIASQARLNSELNDPLKRLLGFLIGNTRLVGQESLAQGLQRGFAKLDPAFVMAKPFEGLRPAVARDQNGPAPVAPLRNLAVGFLQSSRGKLLEWCLGIDPVR